MTDVGPRWLRRGVDQRQDHFHPDGFPWKKISLVPGSRLLPTEQRPALPVAPTTSWWWRTHVLVRSWLNRHRHRWLAPLLVCVPPVGVAMIWAGASRPGHGRRWLTAGAAVWTFVLVLAVVLLTVPSAPSADAGSAPPAAAGGPALNASSSPSATATPARRAASAAAVREAPAPTAGVDRAAVTSGDGSPSDSGSGSGGGTSAGSAPRTGPSSSSPPRATAAPPSPAPTASSTPRPPKPTPTPTPSRKPDHPKPTGKPTIPTANPFTSCSVEGAHALSPNGFSLRCFRTPIGLYWLWG